MNTKYIPILGLLALQLAANAQTNPTPQAIPFNLASQSGSTLPAGVAVHRFGTAIPTTRVTTPGNADLPYNSTQNAGGWRDEAAGGISMLASSSNAAGALVVAIDTSGKTGVQVSWKSGTILQQASRDNSVAVQYRVGTSGNFVDVGTTSTYSSTGQSAGSYSSTFTETLPAAAENQPVVQVRWIYWESAGTAGSRDRIAVDDISITSASGSNPTITTDDAAAEAGSTVTLTAHVTAGTNPTSTGLAVVGNLTAIGGSANQTFTVGSGDTYVYQATIPAGTTSGLKSLPISVTDAQGRSAAATLSIRIGSNITIFHMNDTHARLTPHKWLVPQHGINLDTEFEDVGGAAYLGGKVLSLVGTKPNALVLDGGDISEGNPIGDMNGNGSMTQFYTMLSNKLKTVPGRGGRGMDAVVVGNHDVRDTSYVANLQALAASGVPVVSVNICHKGTKTPYFAASTTVTIDGTKIGILGYTTESAEVGASLTSTLDVVGCDWTSTDNTKIHLADKVNDLRNNQGCSIVVFLAHVGHSTIVNPAAPLLLDDNTAKLPEIAVTGHWHTYTDTVWQPGILDYSTIFTESGSYMKYVGELTVNSMGGYLSSAQHPVTNSTITPDPDIQNFVAGLVAQYDATHSIDVYDVVGYVANDLLLDNKMKWWSANEYPWSGNNTAGQWICDAMLWKAVQLYGSCDLAFEVGGGVRADIPAGPVTFLQVYETFPWNDDTFCRINMTGQEILNFLKQTNSNAGFSRGLDVTSMDGVPTTVTLNGTPLNPAATYTVCINNYMYAHPPSGWTWSDTNPIYRNDVLCRDGIVEFMQTQHGTPQTAYSTGGPRYHLNTEFSGGYRAVVTMMNDGESNYTFRNAFVRLLSATPETLARRGLHQVPADLVNADGSVNPANRLSEMEIYRSYLGFRTGALQPGDIIELWGKCTSYQGNPEFVDQEGIYADGVEFKIVGHDASLAKPAVKPSIASFWNDAHKNHYVTFLARKTGTNTIADQFGQAINTYDVSGYSNKTLPGNVNDLLIVTGMPTMESYAMRFRCHTAVLASTQGISSFPTAANVFSSVQPVLPWTTASSMNLVATATANPGNTLMFAPVADAQVASGNPTTNYGTSNNLYIQSSTSGYGNERAWLRFDLSGIPLGTSISAASLQLYCWKATGAALPTEVRSCSDDTWSETTINWSNQPASGSVLDTRTLAAGTASVWYSWDVTSFVLSKLSGNKLVSLLAKPVTENSTNTPAPSYAFDAKEYGSNAPVLQITTTAAPATVASVEFFYRYSSDSSTWGAWTSAGSTITAPYSLTFTFPQGYGFYEFYSRATSSTNAVEPAPFAAQAATHYVATPPYATTPIITLGNLTQTYDGNNKPVSTTILPPGLPVSVTYNGSATVPVNAGLYNVVATVSQPGFSGSAAGTLTVGRATQSITFPALSAVQVGAAPFALPATATSGLPVSYASSNTAVATVSGNILTVVGAGTVTITASQGGNANFYAATDVARDLTVTAADTGDIPLLPPWAMVGLVVVLFATGLRCLPGARSTSTY